MFWITLQASPKRRRLLLQALAAFLLLLSLSACGSKRSMEGGQSDEDLGSVQDDSAAQIEGEEEAVSFDESEARRRRVASIKGGSTRSGPGKLEQVTTKAGDTLWKIAERKDVYGSGWLYPLIYKANKEKIKDPNNLPGGLVLIVPRDVPDPEVEIAKEEAMTGQYLEKSPVAVPPPPPAPVAPKAKRSYGWLWALLFLAAAGAAFAWWRKNRAAAPPAPTVE